MSDIKQTIRAYLNRAPTSYFTIRCFVGMIQTGEATIEDFKAVSGNDQELIDRIQKMLEEFD